MKRAGMILCGWLLTGTILAQNAPGWPQWRGPTRDGIAPAGPKLLDSWPTNGPTLLWKSPFIPGTEVEGGMSSIVVAGGKVVAFVQDKTVDKPVKVFTSQLMKDWGWMADMPEDLANRMEKARKTRASNLKAGPELDACVSEFLATLAPEQVARFGDGIRIRMTQDVMRAYGPHGARYLPEWAEMISLTKMQDKEFATLEECWTELKKHLGYFQRTPSAELYSRVLLPKLFPPCDRVVCLDAATGNVLWKSQGFPATLMIGYGGVCWCASATPTISGDKCYVQGSAGLYCLSMKDGSLVWKTNTDFCQSSPLVMNGVVYARNALVSAYNADTGRLLWRTGENFLQNYTSVIPWTSVGKQYLISMGSSGNQYYQGRAYCIDPDDGRVVWETTNYVSSMAATPVIAGDMLVSDRAVVKLTPAGGGSSWPLKSGAGNHSGSAIVYQGHVYVHASRPEGVVCDDLNTGAVKWKCANVDPSGVAILVDGKLIGNCDAGTIMYRATPDKYEELGRFKSNATICTSPAVVDGKLFLRLKDGVACYDLTK